MANRDNFSKPTIETLAKRVGYICSNPSCKKNTSGPNAISEKSTSIGVASHITAAAPGGPRYDSTISPEERCHISNGIWLCANCSIFIDKDERNYPSELLKIWKYQAELDMKNSLTGQVKAQQQGTPILEADLIWRSAMRSNIGYSSQNNTDLWEFKWRLSLVIHNNSSLPAYNVQIELEEDVKFIQIRNLPKINNLPAFANLDLEAHAHINYSCSFEEAEAILAERIPKVFDGLRIKILYKNEVRCEYETLFIIQSGELINQTAK